ncbi:MAG: type III-A CRISPR-associated RAMP protein Csm3 [Oscillibacter sp.]|nr:type III-A CRISPR-associated RAMP protein Csm3 [Oscillibacter sp.]
MYGKILIKCELAVRNGLHIGASSGFSAIGAVDSPVVRDPMSGYPIVPGSSLKGKLRTLLARELLEGKKASGAYRNAWDNDPQAVKRLFGSSDPIQAARLQFADCPVLNPLNLRPSEMTEVKVENSIDRSGGKFDGRANPRQIERVNSGISFSVRIVYEAYNGFESQATRDDLQLLATAMHLLQWDYLGGHGSRGSGRVSFLNFRLSPFPEGADMTELEKIFAPVEEEEPFQPDEEGGAE